MPHTSIDMSNYIRRLHDVLPEPTAVAQPWEITYHAAGLIEAMIAETKRGKGKYKIKDQIAEHKNAQISPHAVIEPPVLIGPQCVIGPGAYVHGGVFLGREVIIGPNTEVKASFILDRVQIGHGCFVADSLIGEDAALEPGAVIANHLTERRDKNIRVVVDGDIQATGLEHFGAVIGDRAKIGANAVLTPGTLLKRNEVVPRLELVDQLADLALNGPSGM